MDIKITVFEEEQYDGDWLPESGLELIDWLKSKIKSVPPRYRKDVKIEFDSTVCYDSSSAAIEIYYYRPETKKEVKKRNDGKEQMEKAERDREIALLERLQKKYSV